MNPRALLTVTTALACLLSSSPAQSPIEKEHTELKEKREKALQLAAEPINRRYKEMLDQLFKRATQANDLAAAVKLKEEIDVLAAANLGWLFQGRWVSEGNKKDDLVFAPDGTWVETAGGGVYRGKWKAISATEANITGDNSSVNVYQISKVGRMLKRLVDGRTWVRE